MASHSSPHAARELTAKYDNAAAHWGDKMRTLGYFDAYLGFLAEDGHRAAPGTRVIDIGCGTAAFAEAWAAIQGPDQSVTLLDPSSRMLDRGAARLDRRGMPVVRARSTLEGFEASRPFDAVLAAHVIEHGDDPVAMLRQMRGLTRPGGRLWLVVSKPHWCNAIVWLQWKHRSYRPDRVARMLAAAGWRLDREYAFPFGPPSRTSRGYACTAA